MILPISGTTKLTLDQTIKCLPLHPHQCQNQPHALVPHVSDFSKVWMADQPRFTPERNINELPAVRHHELRSCNNTGHPSIVHVSADASVSM